MGLGVQAMLKDLGFELGLEIMTDASAAKGIASRRGLGKTRHIAVHFLWVQERVQCGDISLRKIWGGENPADLLTKTLDKNTMLKSFRVFGIKYMDGRADSAPALSDDSTEVQCAISCIMPGKRW